MKKTVLAALFLFSLSVHSQVVSNAYPSSTAQDTLTYRNKAEKIFANRWIQSTYIGIPLIIGGLIEKEHSDHFVALRNDIMPSFRSQFDNYLQYAPLAAMLSMKVAGVESRSSWKKMITADALSAVVMASMVNGIKYTAKVERPDGSSKNSFPSGHTATAFMMATMMQKEYGHLSPWVGYGAYSVAMTTGVMRMMNNRHWMSDVMAGAGIGIVATEFGYWLSDLIFPREPKSYQPSSAFLSDNDRNPSFIGTYAGFYVPTTRKNVSTNLRRRTSNGGTVGVEGAWFWNKHFGVGGQVSASNLNYIVESDKQIEGSSHFYSAKAGGYFSLPLYERLVLGAKVLAGYTYYPDNQEDIFDTDKRGGFSALSGINFSLRAKQNLDFKLRVDYEIFHSPVKEISTARAFIFTGGANIRF